VYSQYIGETALLQQAICIDGPEAAIWRIYSENN